MGFVEQDDGSQAVAGGVFESFLQLAHQSEINAGGREAAGDGNFSLHRSRLERPVTLTKWTWMYSSCNSNSALATIHPIMTPKECHIVTPLLNGSRTM